MRFFHNAAIETVYALEDIQVRKAQPDAGQQDQPAGQGWEATVNIKITRADNWFDPAAWEWRHPAVQLIRGHYPGSEPEQSVREDFSRHKIPFHTFGQEIPEEEYTVLQRQYELRATGGLVGGLPDQ